MTECVEICEVDLFHFPKESGADRPLPWSEESIVYQIFICNQASRSIVQPVYLHSSQSRLVHGFSTHQQKPAPCGSDPAETVLL
jgi:hypothetical protein